MVHDGFKFKADGSGRAICGGGYALGRALLVRIGSKSTVRRAVWVRHLRASEVVKAGSLDPAGGGLARHDDAARSSAA
jgi:hypothetical protein